MPIHAPSLELWSFCMGRLREVRGADTRDRDLGGLLGFEHSRTIRWKQGNMYVDRAEHLIRLAQALDVDTMLLVDLASGAIDAARAARQIQQPVRGQQRGRGSNGAAPTRLESSFDGSRFAVDRIRFEQATSGVALLITWAGQSRAELKRALSVYPTSGGLVATNLTVGLVLAERYRPDVVFLDLGLAGSQTIECCRELAGLDGRSQHRSRVIAGSATLSDEIEKTALLAGAALVTQLPFTDNIMKAELKQMVRNSGQRRPAKK